MKSEPLLKVSKEYSKVVASVGGSVVYFVDRHWALRKGFLDMLNFRVTHPLDKNFVEYRGKLERF